MEQDLLTLESNEQPGEALLQPVRRKGCRLGSLESLTSIRERMSDQLARLPEALKTITRSAPYPVTIDRGSAHLSNR
ncbi:MAG: hypothetical protein ACRERU_20395 [Methylococcales bacterium]